MRQRLLSFQPILLACLFLLAHFQPAPAWAGFSLQQTPPDNPPTPPSRSGHGTHDLRPQPVDLVLLPGSVSVENKTVPAGGKTRVWAMAVNRDATAFTRVRVRFSCSGTKKDIFIPLRPRERQRIHADLVIPGPAGQKTILVEINPVHREIEERDYGNNSGRVNITIYEKKRISRQQPSTSPHPADGVGFRPSDENDLELVARSVRVNKKNISPGDEVTVSALVKNRGEMGQKRIRVRFSCGPEQKDVFIHLRPRAQRSARANITIPGPAGKKTIVVEVNPLHRELAESTYRNNRETLRIVLIKQRHDHAPQPVPAFSATGRGDGKPRHIQQPAVISDMKPDRLVAGREYLVKLTGMRLKGSLLPDFGPGIVRTGKLKQLETMMITRIKINAGAEAGPRPLYLAGPDGRRRQPVRFLVVAAKMGDGITPVKKPGFTHEQPGTPPPPPAPMANAPQEPDKNKKKTAPPDLPGLHIEQPDMNGPQFWSMTPSRWQQGREYTVTVKGKDFSPGHWALLQNGLQVTTSYKDSSTLTLHLKTGKKASPGPRTLTICTGQKPSDGAGPAPAPDCRRTSLNGWVVRAIKPGPMPPLACQDLEDSQTTPGLISLKSPQSGFSLYPYIPGTTYQNGTTTPGHGGSYEYRDVPRLDDQTLFSWYLPTPALAQWYELQFLDLQKQILKTIRLSADQLQATPELVTELYQLVRSGAPSFTNTWQNPHSSSDDFPGAIPSPDGATAGCYASCYDPDNTGEDGQPPPCLYNQQDGTHGQDFMTAEEKLNCMRQKHAGEYGLLWRVKAYRHGLPGPCSRDKVVLAGELTGISDYGYLWLGDSPTGTSCDRGNTELTAHNITKDKESNDLGWYPGETIALDGTFSLHLCPWHVTGHPSLAPMNAEGPAYRFDNAFVDWGDGRVQPLAAVMKDGDGKDLQAENTFSLRVSHQYDLPGRYQARIYVLAADDLDELGAISGQNAYQPPAAEKSGKQSLSGPTGKKIVSAPRFQPKAGGRIYQLYCNPVDITIVQDLAATGPLHLMDLAIVSFSSDEPAATAMEHASSAAPGNTIQQAGPKKTLQAGMSAHPSLSTASQNTPTVSTCDAGLWARARLRYYGQGYIRLTWLVDGIAIKTEERRLGPSTLRKDLGPDPATWNSDPIPTDSFYLSPSLPVRVAGRHRLDVKATVIADKTASMVNGAALLFNGGTAPGTYSHLHQAGGKQAQIMADSHVEAPEREYLARQGTEETCNLFFAVDDPGDYFLVTGLRDLEISNHSYSGRGTLIYRLPDSPWSVREFYQPVEFSGWKGNDLHSSLAMQSGKGKLRIKKPTLSMAGGRPEGIVITSGRLQTGAGQDIDDLPGMRVRLRGLAGQASAHVNGVFDVAVKDSTLRLAGSEEPQAWQGLSAPLTPEGDWYIAGQQLGLTRIGWSLFNIESGDVRIDLSHRRGTAGDSGNIARHPTGTEWIGIHLGEADLYPYTFDLANNVTIKTRNWVIEEGGLSGTAGGNNFEHAFGDGTIGWAAMDIKVRESRLEASYKGMFVEMAWPRARLEGGDAHLTYAPGANADVRMNFAPGEPVREEYGPVALEATVLGLEHHHDWGINTDTVFQFFQRDERIGTALVNDMFFTIFSKAEFGNGDNSCVLALNDTEDFGGAEVTWNKLDIRANGKKCGLDLTLAGSMTLKEIADTPVTVKFATRKQNKNVTASGPDIQKFDPVDYTFPQGTPVLRATIKNLAYQGNGSGMTAGLAGQPMYAANTLAGAGAVFSDAWLNPGEYPLLAGINAGTGGSGCNQDDTFHAEMTTKLFDGTDFDMVFRYGNKGYTYWLGYVRGDLAQPIPLYPPALFMTSFTGGMAYNFPENVFNQGNGLHACPQNGAGLIFAGGVGLSILQDVITTEGMMTIALDGKIPTTYAFNLNKITLLEMKTGLHGKLVFDASVPSFEGGVWGNFDFASEMLKLKADEGSVELHMGLDKFHAYIGTDTSPITLELLKVLHGTGYYMLGTDIHGFKAGATVHADIATCKGECNKDHANCAYVQGNLDADISGSYQPISFQADGSINIGLGGCVDCKIWTGCKGIETGVDMGLGINPNKLWFSTSFDLWVGDVTLGIRVLPNLGFIGP